MCSGLGRSLYRLGFLLHIARGGVHIFSICGMGSGSSGERGSEATELVTDDNKVAAD